MTMQLLKTTFDGNSQFGAPLTYVVIFVFVGAAVLNVHFLNMGTLPQRLCICLVCALCVYVCVCVCACVCRP